MMKHFPLPLQFQPTRWNKRFQTWDRNCLVASHHPLALNAGALQMLWWLWSWCGCCCVRGMSTRAAIFTSAHTEDVNSPSKPPWGSQCTSRAGCPQTPSLLQPNYPAERPRFCPAQGFHGKQGGDMVGHWLDVVGAEPSSPRSPQAGVKPCLVGCSARASGLGQSSLLPLPQSPLPAASSKLLLGWSLATSKVWQ